MPWAGRSAVMGHDWKGADVVGSAERRPARVAVVGVGNVGASFAYALPWSGLAAEIVLIDANRDRAEGEAMDLNHAVPFAHPTRIWAGEYADCAGAAVTVIAAGANQKPGETRLDLLAKNAAIFRQIVPRWHRRRLPEPANRHRPGRGGAGAAPDAVAGGAGRVAPGGGGAARQHRPSGRAIASYFSLIRPLLPTHGSKWAEIRAPLPTSEDAGLFHGSESGLERKFEAQSMLRNQGNLDEAWS